MDKVGESKKRNKDYKRSFTREKLFRRLVDKRAPVIFDVGAHTGESVKYLREIFPRAIIYSFEPDPESFSKLLSGKTENHYCFNIALSNVNGQISFYKNEISHTNSIFRVNTRSRDSIKIQEALHNNDHFLLGSFNHEIKVKSVRLDDFVREKCISDIDLLKIDVQGAESLVLEGAAKALTLTKVIAVEVLFYDYYEKKTSFLEIEQFLAPKGFRLFSISELSHNPMNGRTDWAEVVYTRD